jgi:threonine/homoserine efflux transporter RhtA
VVVDGDRGARRLVVALGITLALMNSAFYLAIDRLPLATVAAIEFVAAIVVALVGVRSFRNVAALIVAVAGVFLLIGFHPKNGNWYVRVWLRLVHFHGHDARSLRLWPSPVG